MAQNPQENVSPPQSEAKILSRDKPARRILPPGTSRQALELREQGCNYRQIAGRLGISIGASHKHVTSALIRREESDRQRVLDDCETVFRMLEKLEPVFVQKGRQGDIGAQKAVKESIHIRCELLKKRAECLFAPV